MADGSYFDDRSGLYGTRAAAIGLPIMLQLEGLGEHRDPLQLRQGASAAGADGPAAASTAGAQLEFGKGAAPRVYGIR